MDLRGQHPINTFQYLVNTDGVNLYNSSGSQVTSSMLTASFSNSSSFSTIASASFISNTSSFSQTSSYLQIGTSSAPPVDTASVVQWIDVMLSGSIYKMPLYL